MDRQAFRDRTYRCLNAAFYTLIGVALLCFVVRSWVVPDFSRQLLFWAWLALLAAGVCLVPMIVIAWLERNRP